MGWMYWSGKYAYMQKSEGGIKLKDACVSLGLAIVWLIIANALWVPMSFLSIQVEHSKWIKRRSLQVAHFHFAYSIYCGYENMIEIFDVQRPGQGSKIPTIPNRKSKQGQKGRVVWICIGKLETKMINRDHFVLGFQCGWPVCCRIL